MDEEQQQFCEIPDIENLTVLHILHIQKDRRTEWLFYIIVDCSQVLKRKENTD